MNFNEFIGAVTIASIVVEMVNFAKYPKVFDGRGDQNLGYLSNQLNHIKSYYE